MSEERIFNRLSPKIREVLKILRETDCSLPDDTYLDHMVSGISSELLQYQDPDKRLEFWNSSSCSNFVQSFAVEKEGCQQFILRLLHQVCLTHYDINKQCHQIIMEVLERFQRSRIIPNQTYLDLLIEACAITTKATNNDIISNFNWFPRSEMNIWEMLLKPIIIMPSSDLPKSHFWKISFIKLTSKFVTSCLMHNVENGSFLTNSLYPDLALTALGIEVFNEILDTFLVDEGPSDMANFNVVLQKYVQDDSAVEIFGFPCQIKALVILQEHKHAQFLLEKQLLDGKIEGISSIQLWYKSLKPLLESCKMQPLIPEKSLLGCMFQDMKIDRDSPKICYEMIVSVQGISAIKLSKQLRNIFEQHIFEILEAIVAYNMTRNIDFSSTTNIQLITSLITALNVKDQKTSLTLQRLKVLSTLSKNLELSVHLQSQILECIQNLIKHIAGQTSDFSIQNIMLELWNHSLSGSDWRIKDLLSSILSSAFKNSYIQLMVSKAGDEEFPWRCLFDFIQTSSKDNNSFVRSSSIELISSMCQRINRSKTEKSDILRENFEQLYGITIHMLRFDTEAIVRRAILRESILSQLKYWLEPEALFADADFQAVLTNAIVDLDWEVKEEALTCFGSILQLVLNKPINVGNVPELVVILKTYHLVKVFIICLDDYDRRFLHKTYAILQTFHNYLMQNFCRDDLQHECSNDCNSGTRFLETEMEYGVIQPKETHINDNSVENHEIREEVISNILQEEKFALVAKNFKTLHSSKIYDIPNKNSQKACSKPVSESLPIKNSANKKEFCIRKFLHHVRFGIAFKSKLKEFDAYCEERNSLENVLDDIILSVREGNVIDGIDCY